MAEGNEKTGLDVPEQHPYVERLRPDPSKPPRSVTSLTGLLGRSDQSGYQRLYFTRDLGTYAEFPSADLLFVEPVPAAESPIKGIDASRITLNSDATIHYTRSTKANTLGEFDLNVRAAPARAMADPIAPPLTNFTCPTVCAHTCDTCHTQCGTCGTC